MRHRIAIGFMLSLGFVSQASGQTIIFETQELVTVPPLTEEVTFGWRVAIDSASGIAAVGAPIDNGSTGAAYIFRRDGNGVWLQEERLLGVGITDDFGVCAVAGDIVAVGAPGRAMVPVPATAGAVDVFRWDGFDWNLETTLIGYPDDGDADFGDVVVMNEDLLVVGAPGHHATALNWGTVHVYRDQPMVGWVEEAVFESSPGYLGEEFGGALATNGDVIAVGDRYQGAGGVQAGAVHVFRRVVGSWVLETVLDPGQPFQSFGAAVAVVEDVLVIGAPNSNNGQGAVHVFRHDGLLWVEESVLPGSASLTGFGHYLAAEEDLILVGQGSASGGIVHTYRYLSGAWTSAETLTSAVPTSSFGHPIAASGDSVVVGAGSAETTGGVETGAAYYFDLTGVAQPPPQFRRGDTNDDGLFNIADAIAALNALFGTDPVGCVDSADANDDGAFDIADAVSILSALFVTGSPPPPAPHPGCGIDPTGDPLLCTDFASCP